MSADLPPPSANVIARQRDMRPRQELAVRRFTQYCKGQWGSILFHKVGTGKTISSLLIAMNSFTAEELRPAAASKKIFIVSPSKGVFQNFVNDLTKKLPIWAHYFSADRLINYPYYELIEDLNTKSWRHDMTGCIVIFDEAHRLLGKEVFNSKEAGSNVQKHPILEDIYFIHKIDSVKKCILLTGTPIQVDVADICRLLNFVSRKRVAKTETTLALSKPEETDYFTTQRFAPVQVDSTMYQWAAAIFVNFLRGMGALIAGDLLSKAGFEISKFGPEGPILPGFVLPMSALLLFLLAFSIIGYGHLQIRKLQKGWGKTRKAQKGGMTLLGNAANLLVPAVKTAATLTLGPSGPGVPLSTAISKFSTESIIASFQDIADEFYSNNWKIDSLAKMASPYISVYDPDIQKKLKRQSYNLAALTALKGSPGISTFIGQEPLQNATKTKGIKDIFISTYIDNEPLLDMPLKVKYEPTISYDNTQLNLLRRMFSGELSQAENHFFNLDQYEPKNPDVKAKYMFFRKFARMVGNFSTDMMQYYTVINAEGTDYQLFRRNDGTEVTELPKNLFTCEKFEHCLQELERMRKTGYMKDPTWFLKPKANKPTVEKTEEEAEAVAAAAEKEAAKVANEEPGLEAVEEVEAEAAAPEAEEEMAKDEMDQPHLKEGRTQYLPLVYSYTEDYGLGPFCMFLKARGYRYILCHTKQNPDLLVENVNRGKSYDTNPLFPPLVEKEAPLCVLIDPTMTEGYDFVYNPAIFVLEPCNTFGDQEQVYGRILRSYSEEDIEKFKTEGGKRKEKLVVQYCCLTDKDRWYYTKLYALYMKGRFWESRIFLTPQQYFQTFQRAKIVSPDYYALKRLEKEEKYLKNFEIQIRGGADFSDMIESLMCMKTTEITDCEPLRGTPCARGGYRRTKRKQRK